MTDWFDRLARLAALGERISTLTDGVRTLAARVEDHQTRLVRLETIIEITRPDGAVLRLAAKPAGEPPA
ncbi:MAG TPA: hypothetical protein VFW75_04935 [Acetobacteraceae bacterium]|nr:hypothetical protein [Acetobacteraceae bacterium]